MKIKIFPIASALGNAWADSVIKRYPITCEFRNFDGVIFDDVITDESSLFKG